MKTPSSVTDRSAYRVALATMAILLVGSVVWYKQRILFLDPSFIAYEVLDLGTLMISERRYGSFITQGFPWLAGQLGFSLRGVLLAYSVGFYLFYTTVVVVVGILWDQYRLGTLLGLYFTLVVSDVYFWTNNEIHQAVTWMMLFLGCYCYLDGKKERFNIFDHFILVLLICLAASTHLLIAAPFAFLWVYLGLEALYRRGADAKPWRLAVYTALIGLAVYVRFTVSHTTSYDKTKLMNVDGLKIRTFFEAFGNGMSETMQRYFIEDYWLLFPIGALGLIGLIVSRRWLLIPTVILAAIGYYGLVCVTFNGSFDRLMLFYVESEWMGFGLIVATPFVFHFLPLLKNRGMVMGLMALVFGLRLFAIANSFRFFQQRFHNLTTMVEELQSLPGNKFVLQPTTTWDAYFSMRWSLPLESLLLSSLPEYGPPVTIKPYDPNRSDTTNSNTFLSNFRTQPVTNMESRYFRLDTLNSYRLLTPEERDAITGKLRSLPKR